MRAVRCERQGPPEEMKLVELPDPVPAAGEAVVRLYACGLNRRDVWIRQGLYARIRHPLYLGEAIATIGVLLLYRIPAAFALVAIQFCLQLWRMREEEKVLAAAFPEYAEYRQRTARLIPGIY